MLRALSRPQEDLGQALRKVIEVSGSPPGTLKKVGRVGGVFRSHIGGIFKAGSGQRPGCCSPPSNDRTAPRAGITGPHTSAVSRLRAAISGSSANGHFEKERASSLTPVFTDLDKSEVSGPLGNSGPSLMLVSRVEGEK